MCGKGGWEMGKGMAVEVGVGVGVMGGVLGSLKGLSCNEGCFLDLLL